MVWDRSRNSYQFSVFMDEYVKKHLPKFTIGFIIRGCRKRRETDEYTPNFK